ncbi:serine beta-lactamase-like protein LACTB, mitochondrial isoform X2 [Artemia franciscana]|uniref:serine beta-lactamase-like protein LACTB, mitochondrial isoform X2 n=1 Tax=Artemia franciscana TaxID=6661 RepID=UPI0032DA298A
MKYIKVCAGVLAGITAVPFFKTTEQTEKISSEKGSQTGVLHGAVAQLQEKILHRCRIEMEKSGSPGLVIAASVDGKTIFSAGIGFADIENNVLCDSSTVMRIASISKSMTMTAVAKAYEEGKLDLDKPIYDYLPNFPAKQYNGKEVVITTKQLVSHLGGIRHYDKSKKKELTEKEKEEEEEFKKKEYYIKEEYKSVQDALELFKHDELRHEPGSKYLYTTHGWTVVSAVLEKALKKDFKEIMDNVFRDLGLKTTHFDENSPIIMNRSRFYVRDKHGRLMNAPYVDNSYKWAGGGFVSTVGDLIQFGNAMLYSYQRKDVDKHFNKTLPGYLKRETMEMIWSPIIKTKLDRFYGMGWGVMPAKKEIAFGDENRYHVSHSVFMWTTSTE